MLDLTIGIFAALLLPTGWAKLRRPEYTVRALRSTGWPGSRVAVFGLGFIEINIGVAVLVTGWPIAVAGLGVLYLGFLVWLATAMRAGGVVSSCGCAGTPETPPTTGHVLVNALAVTAVAIELVSSRGEIGPWPSDTLPFLASVLVVVVGALLAYMVITDGARLAGAIKS